MLVLILAILIAGMMAGCSGGDSSATKKEEDTFRDRNPAHMKGPPAGFSPSGPPAAATAGPASAPTGTK